MKQKNEQSVVEKPKQMSKEKQQKQIINALLMLSEQKGILKEEAKEFLTQAFIKAFNKDEDNWDWKNPIEEAEVHVDLDIEKGELKIKKIYKVVETLDPITKLKEIELSDPRIANLNLKIGDHFEEPIDLTALTDKKIRTISQIFKQRTTEAEKTKLYNAFIENKGKLITAKIIKVFEDGNSAMLDKDGTSIFLPKQESNPTDRLKEGKLIQVFVVNVNEKSKDAQVIASRAHTNFVIKLLEEEIDEIANGTLEIKAISREAGIKTKIVVSSNNQNVDPVGTIIGPKGSKIKHLMELLNGERIDVIPFSTDEGQLIANAFFPAEIIGLKIIVSPEGRRDIIAIVNDDQFLSVIGKRGINVKLVAKLVGAKLDVKLLSDAKRANLDYQPIVLQKKTFSPRPFNRDSNNFNQPSAANMITTSISEILEMSDDDIDLNDMNLKMESTSKKKKEDSKTGETSLENEAATSSEESDIEY